MVNPFRVSRDCLLLAQGSRCARTAGLKLANAFGVKTKLTQYHLVVQLHRQNADLTLTADRVQPLFSSDQQALADECRRCLRKIVECIYVR